MLKYSRFLLLLMMILPWFSLPFIDKKSFKRYYPASLFISIVVWLESYIAKKEDGGGFMKVFIQKYGVKHHSFGVLFL